MHGRNFFNEKKQFQFCETYTDSIFTAKLYTIKELVMMDSSILDFHQYLYIPEIKIIAFHLPHVRMIVTHNCGKNRQEAFKIHSDF